MIGLPTFSVAIKTNLLFIFFTLSLVALSEILWRLETNTWETVLLKLSWTFLVAVLAYTLIPIHALWMASATILIVSMLKWADISLMQSLSIMNKS